MIVLTLWGLFFAAMTEMSQRNTAFCLSGLFCALALITHPSSVIFCGGLFLFLLWNMRREKVEGNTEKRFPVCHTSFMYRPSGVRMEHPHCRQTGLHSGEQRVQLLSGEQPGPRPAPAASRRDISGKRFTAPRISRQRDPAFPPMLIS